MPAGRPHPTSEHSSNRTNPNSRSGGFTGFPHSPGRGVVVCGVGGTPLRSPRTVVAWVECPAPGGSAAGDPHLSVLVCPFVVLVSSMTHPVTGAGWRVGVSLQGNFGFSGYGLSEINIFSVGDSQDKHTELPVCNFVDYAVVTDANTVLVVLTF